jgi:hypothetical protein
VKINKQLPIGREHKRANGIKVEPIETFPSLETRSKDSADKGKDKEMCLGRINSFPRSSEDEFCNPCSRIWTPPQSSRMQTKQSTRSLLSSEDEVSLTDTWSPFIPGLQGDNEMNGHYDNEFHCSHWNQTPIFHSSGVSVKKESFRGENKLQVVHQDNKHYINRSIKLKGSSSKIDGKAINFPTPTRAPSPTTTFTSQSRRYLSPNYSTRQSPMLSVDTSDILPISLTKEISSSFYIPFVGMTESLSYALGITQDSDQGITPKKIKFHNGYD